MFENEEQRRRRMRYVKMSMKINKMCEPQEDMFSLLTDAAKSVGITLDTRRWQGKGMDVALQLMLQCQNVEHGGMGRGWGMSLFAQLAFIIMRNRGIDAQLVIPHGRAFFDARKKIPKYTGFIFSDKIWEPKGAYAIITEIERCSPNFINTVLNHPANFYVGSQKKPAKATYVVGE